MIATLLLRGKLRKARAVLQHPSKAVVKRRPIASKTAHLDKPGAIACTSLGGLAWQAKTRKEVALKLSAHQTKFETEKMVSSQCHDNSDSHTVEEYSCPSPTPMLPLARKLVPKYRPLAEALYLLFKWR